MIPASVQAVIDAADYVVGSDECGYGSWAGPLVVCAIVVPKVWPLAHLVKDSKAFNGNSEQARTARAQVASQLIKAVIFNIVSVSPAEIDEFGVYKILPVAHGRAINGVIKKHEALGVVGTNAVIVDGSLKVTYGDGKLAVALPKADALIAAVSGASIIGKVAHDAHMVKMAKQYPGYGFESNMGYGGNPAHDEGLKKLGPCEIHRKSYGPIRDLAKKTEQAEFDFSTLGGDEE